MVTNGVTVQGVVDRLRALGLTLSVRAAADTVLRNPVAWQAFAGEGITFQMDRNPAIFAPWTNPHQGLVLCSSILESMLGPGPFAFTADPKLAFVRACSLFMSPPTAAIHPSAIVNPGATIGREVSIGPNSVIGRCTIGDGTRIGALVYVGDDVTIGRNVTVQNGAHLGNDGIGAVRDAAGKLVAFPHFETLIVEDDVWVGSGAELHRGVLLPTRIGRGTHVGSRSEIGHNATIGQDVCITAGVIVAGSAHVGNKVFIGCGAFIKEGIRVADEVYIAAHATVMKRCEERGVSIVGPSSRSVGRLLS